MKTIISLGLAVLMVLGTIASADAGHHHRGGRHKHHKHHHRHHTSAPVQTSSPTMVAVLLSDGNISG
jgi:hypothetical protein